MDTSKNHYSWINIAKGMGIIIVVMGHTIFPLHIAIDVFHMPLFLVIAGLTLTHNNLFKDFLIKKINRIFIPYIFFFSAILVLQVVIKYDGPGLWFHLWFLQSMFVGIIISYIVTKHTKNEIGIVIMLFCLLYGWCMARYNLQILPLHIDRGILSAGFILLGYYLKPFIFQSSNLSRNWKKIGLCFIFITIYVVALYLSIRFYDPICSMSRMDLGRYGIHLCMLTTIAGILSVVFFAQIVSHCKLLEWLGKNSLVIFIIHCPFTELLNVFFSSFAEGKGILIHGVTAMMAYITYLALGALFVPICKRYLPKVSGYKNMIN